MFNLKRIYVGNGNSPPWRGAGVGYTKGITKKV